MGVQEHFTRSLDIALLNNKDRYCRSSMKDVPVVLPQKGITQAAVKRGSYKDLLVAGRIQFINKEPVRIWLLHSLLPPAASVVKPNESIAILEAGWKIFVAMLIQDWKAGGEWVERAIFAATGLERVAPSENSIELDWMLPAPAESAIMVVCGLEDRNTWGINPWWTYRYLRTKAENAFPPGTLMGGCSAPISALASVNEGRLKITGISFPMTVHKNWKWKKETLLEKSYSLGVDAALEILDNGGEAINGAIRNSEG